MAQLTSTIIVVIAVLAMPHNLVTASKQIGNFIHPSSNSPASSNTIEPVSGKPTPISTSGYENEGQKPASSQKRWAPRGMGDFGHDFSKLE